MFILCLHCLLLVVADVEKFYQQCDPGGFGFSAINVLFFVISLAVFSLTPFFFLLLLTFPSCPLFVLFFYAPELWVLLLSPNSCTLFCLPQLLHFIWSNNSTSQSTHLCLARSSVNVWEFICTACSEGVRLKICPWEAIWKRKLLEGDRLKISDQFLEERKLGNHYFKKKKSLVWGSNIAPLLRLY